MRFVCACCLALAGTAFAQTATDRAPGALLRALDKVSGEVVDFTLLNGGQARMGRLVVSLGVCRYPPDNQQGEAYAWLQVQETGDMVFSGWMIASSPALNAMDHPRYDVWVLRCSNS